MRKISQTIISGGRFYLFSLLFADILNFLFNAFLGRVLTFEEFGLVTFINTLWFLVSVFMSALATTVSRETAYIVARENSGAAVKFYKRTFKKTLIFTSIISVLWILLVPLTSEFFDISGWQTLLLFTPILMVTFLTAVNRGYLQGRLSYGPIGIFQSLASISKLGLAILLWSAHVNVLIYTAIIISEVVNFLFTMVYVWFKTRSHTQPSPHKFPIQFFNASVSAKMSSVSFLVLDIILAKHFLTPVIAGEYAILSLVGKMIFYFGSLFGAFIPSLISRQQGLKHDPNKTFYKIFGITSLLTLTMYLFVGLFGSVSVPFLFGDHARAVLAYLPYYGLAIVFFTLGNQIVTYRLSRKSYIFPITAFISAGLVVLGVIGFHKNISDIVAIVLSISFINFLSLLLLNTFDVSGTFIKQNTIDLLDAFFFKTKKDDRLRGKTGKKILIFNWRDTKHVFAGGAEVYIHEIAKRWAKQGNVVTIFCGNDGKSKRYEIIDDIEIVRRGGFYFVYIWAFVYYMSQFRGRYDVIIDSENGIPFFTPLYVKETVYCLMHHVHQDVFRRSLIKPLALFAQFFEEDLTPLVYRNVKFITVSESTKKDMKRIGLGKAGVDIIHPGVTLTELNPGVKANVPTVLYLGRLKYYKSIHVLLHAVPRIVQDMKNAKIIIAGDGEEGNPLKKLAKKLKITDSVQFLGKVTEEEKIALYQSAWVFVNPSMMEGWGITTIEANACGTPIVASDVPGLRDAVSDRNSGFLVDYGNSEAFAKKIFLLLKNETLRDNMSKKAVLWARNFDWEKSASQFLSILQNSYKRTSARVAIYNA